MIKLHVRCAICPQGLFPKQTFVLPLCKKCLLKTMGKEKLLVPRISPFPKVLSILSENFLTYESNLKLTSANSFSINECKICGLRKDSEETLQNLSFFFLISFR